MIKGIDIYHDNDADLSKLSSDIEFVFCKATQGATYKDPMFNIYWQKLKMLSVCRGAYHFLNATDSAQEQAENFLSLGIDFSKPNVLPPVLDVEDQVPASNNANITKNKTAFIQLVTDWINIVEAKTQRRVIIYSYKTFFSDYLNNHAWPENYLWLSAIQNQQPGLPLGYTHYDFWQNSWNGTLSGQLTGGQIDQNLYNGTIEQLKNL